MNTDMEAEVERLNAVKRGCLELLDAARAETEASREAVEEAQERLERARKQEVWATRVASDAASHYYDALSRAEEETATMNRPTDRRPFVEVVHTIFPFTPNTGCRSDSTYSVYEVTGAEPCLLCSVPESRPFAEKTAVQIAAGVAGCDPDEITITEKFRFRNSESETMYIGNYGLVAAPTWEITFDEYLSLAGATCRWADRDAIIATITARGSNV